MNSSGIFFAISFIASSPKKKVNAGQSDNPVPPVIPGKRQNRKAEIHRKPQRTETSERSGRGHKYSSGTRAGMRVQYAPYGG
jgi:hypothetical protein